MSDNIGYLSPWYKLDDHLPKQNIDVIGYIPTAIVSGPLKMIYRSEGKWFSCETGLEELGEVILWCCAPPLPKENHDRI